MGGDATPMCPDVGGDGPGRGGPGLVPKAGAQRISYAPEVGGLGVHPGSGDIRQSISAILADRDLSGFANRALSSLTDRTSMILTNQHLTIFAELFSANFADLFSANFAGLFLPSVANPVRRTCPARAPTTFVPVTFIYRLPPGTTHCTVRTPTSVRRVVPAHPDISPQALRGQTLL